MILINEKVTTKDNNDISLGTYLYWTGIDVFRENRGLASTPITAVSIISKKFTVTGDISDKIGVGSKFTISSSTGNNGTYTVKTVAVVLGNTEIVVDETIADSTDNGNVDYADLTYVLSIDVGGYVSEKFANSCNCGNEDQIKLDDGSSKPIQTNYQFNITEDERTKSNWNDLANTKIKAQLEADGYTASKVVII